MRKVIAIAVLLLLIGGTAYLYYVRGVGVSAQIQRPATIERIGGVRTYSWGVSTAMPTPRTEVAAAMLAGKIYVAGGERPGATHAEVEAFDPESGCWLSLPPLPTARHDLAAAVVDNVLYVIGGGTHPGLSVSGRVEALEVH